MFELLIMPVVAALQAYLVLYVLVRGGRGRLWPFP